MRQDVGTDDPRVRVRPGKGSRPHTKICPDYSSICTAEVVGVDHSHYRLVLADGLTITTVKAHKSDRGSVAVGDRVWVTGNASEKKDTLARVVSVEARVSRLLRSTEEGNGRGHCIVANAQQLAVITALAGPPPKTGMIDRCLTATYDTRMGPLLVLTEADLASPDQLLGSYGTLGSRTVVVDLGPHRDLEARRFEKGNAKAGRLETLRKALASVETVLVSHSGVGKSTLINTLMPDADRTTGEVNAVTGKGRHMSTSAVSLALPGGGRIIDTPGIRSFGLAHVSPQDALRGFTNLAAIAEDCPHGCKHGRDSPECALSEQTNLRLIARTASSRRLLAVYTEDWS